MNIPFGNIQNLMNNFYQFKQNAPQKMGSNPNTIIQDMMNSGMISQQQYNQAQMIAKQLQRFLK